MKKILSLLVLVVCAVMAQAQTNDTIMVSNLESTYDGKMSFSVKNVVNIIYSFTNGETQYKITAYGGKPTMISGSDGIPSMKYEIKKAFINGTQTSEFSHISVKPKVEYKNGAMVQTNIVVLYRK